MDDYIKREDAEHAFSVYMGFSSRRAGEQVHNALQLAKTADVAPVRHLRRSDVYEPFYQWLGMPSASDEWIALRSLIDDLVDRCGAKMDKEGDQ